MTHPALRLTTQEHHGLQVLYTDAAGVTRDAVVTRAQAIFQPRGMTGRVVDLEYPAEAGGWNRVSQVRHHPGGEPGSWRLLSESTAHPVPDPAPVPPEPGD